MFEGKLFFMAIRSITISMNLNLAKCCMPGHLNKLYTLQLLISIFVVSVRKVTNSFHTADAQKWVKDILHKIVDLNTVVKTLVLKCNFTFEINFHPFSL